MKRFIFVLAVGLLLISPLFVSMAMPMPDLVAAERIGLHNSAEALLDGPFLAAGEATLTFQQGVSPDAAYAGVTDTYIFNEKGRTNFGQDPYLRVNYDGRQKVLLRFDLSNYIPTDAVITSAKLELYSWYKDSGAVTDIGVYELLRSWNEDETTWYEAAHGSDWQVAGCNGLADRASEYVAVATLRYINTWQVWESTPLVSLVQRWVSDPASNHGLVLSGLSGNSIQWWSLYSSQWGANKNVRPKLTVSFYVATPTPTITPTQVITEGVVGGVAWHDENGDGVRDPGESPMAGITIVLRDSHHAEVARRTTLQNGSYEFASLDPGSYLLTKEDPPGYICTRPPGGTYAFYLSAGQRLTDFDFGFALPTTLTPTPTSTHTATPTGVVSQTPIHSPTPTSTSTQTMTPTSTATTGPSPTPTSTPIGTLQDPVIAICGASYSGTTDGHPASISDYSGCGIFGMWAPEVVYKLQITSTLSYLNINLSTAADLALFVLSSSNPSDCLYTGGTVLAPNVLPGTYYIVVDGTEVGSYDMTINCVPVSVETPTPTLSPTLLTPTPTRSPTFGPSPTPTNTQPPGGPSVIYLPIVLKPPLEFLVNCGADREYVDSAGNHWLKDRKYAAGGCGYVGDSSTWSTSHDIWGTDNMGLYQTQRYGYGSFGYRFDVPNGAYEVELHFAELYYNAAGKRVFDVIIEGQTVLDNYDAFVAAGGRFVADTRVFTAVVRDGQLNVVFARGPANFPMINALRVLKTD